MFINLGVEEEPIVIFVCVLNFYLLQYFILKLFTTLQ